MGNMIQSVGPLDGRWRSPLLSFLTQTQGLTQRALNPHITWCGPNLDADGKPVYLTAEVQSFRTIEDPHGHVLRRNVETSLLCEPKQGLLARAKMVGPFDALKTERTEQAIYLVGGGAWRGLNARMRAKEGYALHRLPKSREMYGIDIWRRGSTRDGLALMGYFIYEPHLSGLPLWEQIVEFDPAHIRLRTLGDPMDPFVRRADGWWADFALQVMREPIVYSGII